MSKFGAVVIILSLYCGAARADITVLFAADGKSASYWDDPSNWPWDIGGYDDSELLYLDITDVYTDSRIVNPPGTSGTNPHADPHQYPCPSLPITVNRSVTGTYSESWTESTSATISSEIGAGIDGIESKVGTSVTNGYSYTEEASTSYTLAITEGPISVPAGASWNWSYTEDFIHFSGTGKYFDDQLWNTVITFSWSVEATYNLQSNGIQVTGGYACPDPTEPSTVPVPSSLLLVGLGGLCLSAKRAVTKRRN